MRSQTSGPITTLLIFVPLVAVPVLAVYGVPQLPSLAATPQEDDLKFADVKSSDAGHVHKSPADSHNDATPADHATASAPSPDNDNPTRARLKRIADSRSATAETKPEPKPEIKTASVDSPWSDGTGLQSEEDTLRPPAEAPPKKSKAATQATTEHQASAGNDHSGSAQPRRDASWQAAVERLRALGIREYRVQPGRGMQGVHFSCQLVSSGNIRITHRFEAEAADPMEAFEKVLAQIDAWKRDGNVAGGEAKLRASADKQQPIINDAPIRSDIDVTTR